MARLQILELPEGTGDERPPFVLVIDQCQGVDLDMVETVEGSWRRVGQEIGARSVLVFMESVEIPANDPPPFAEVVEDPEQAGTTQLVYAHERTRLDLCSALLVSGDTTWHQLVALVGERQQELAGLHQRLDGPPDVGLARLVLNATGIDIAGRPAPDYKELLATACRTVIQSENARDRLRASTGRG